MTLPAHRFESRKKDDGDQKVWLFDFDGTINGAPDQMARIATGLKALGDRVIVLTGNKSPRADLVKTITGYGFPFDELVQYDDDGTNGIGRAHFLKQFDAWGAFDNRIDRAYIFAKVCPHLYLIAKPLDDDANGTKKAAKKAAKDLSI